MRIYRFGRTEQGRNGILWSVYEARQPGDFMGGTLVASFLRGQDAWQFMWPFANDRCKCGHEVSQHVRPARVNCVACECSMPWPEPPSDSSEPSQIEAEEGRQ